MLFQVFYSDKPIVLCAPTGSGKTVIFELAILRLILTQHGNTSYKSKIVYSKFSEWGIISCIRFIKMIQTSAKII